jgi:EAL and modified HD-GYP domain-containing signal transduction protein
LNASKPAAPNTLPALLARQPIFDCDTNIVAYELLFRQVHADNAGVVDGDSATSQVLINAFTHLNMNSLVGDNRVYVNFTRNLIGYSLPFDKSRLVIEVLEDVIFDDELVALIKTLADDGYTIALDDFELKPGAERVLPLVDVVKLDVIALDRQALRYHVEQLRPYNVTLLAEKVETHEDYQFCKDLGFSLFQGYFLCKPQIVAGHKIPPARLVVLELLSKLQDPDIEMRELERLINLDPVIGFKIMTLLNSPLYAMVGKIESLRQAINYLGLNRLRSLASLLALSNLTDKPSGLKVNTMIRAKMCESLGQKIAPDLANRFFSVGLLSTLDAYFDQPLASLIAGFALHPDLSDALLSFSGNCGQVLRAVIAHERAQWDDIDWEYLATFNIAADDINEAYQASIIWQAQSALI